MDNSTRMRRTLDALADLFLTEATSSHDLSSPAGGVSTLEAQPDPFDSGWTASSPDDVTVSLASSAPDSRSGATTTKRNRPEVPAAISPIPLRPGSSIDTDLPDGHESARVVEFVLLGNLPGIGGPWLTQYANYLAQQHGSVAVLHVVDDQVHVEWVTARSQGVEAQDPRTESRFSKGLAVGGLRAALRQLLRTEASSAQRWLIHVRSPMTPEALAIASRLTHWTLLCGADDAAVVGAYRLIKQVVEAQDDDQPTDGADHDIQMMVMGSDEQASTEAVTKINNAAANFLNTAVVLRGWQKQMVPVYSRVLGRFSMDEKQWLLPDLTAFINDLRTQQGPKSSRGSGPRPDPLAQLAHRQIMGHAPVNSDRSWSDEVAQGDPDPWGEPSTQAAAQAADRRAKGPRPCLNGPGLQRPELPSMAGRGPDVDDEPDLCAALAESGVTVALQSPCPRYPQTQLMLDHEGQLHLLRNSTTGAADRHFGDPSESSDAALREAIVELIAARAWVRENMALIQLIQRDSPIDLTSDPVLHLFTDEATMGVKVGQQIGRFVNLHLIKRVHIGSESTWFCTRLN